MFFTLITEINESKILIKHIYKKMKSKSKIEEQ